MMSREYSLPLYPESLLNSILVYFIKGKIHNFPIHVAPSWIATRSKASLTSTIFFKKKIVLKGSLCLQICFQKIKLLYDKFLFI